MSIAFDFDASFPVAPRAAIETAGRVFGENLYPPAGPNEIRVSVGGRDLTGRLAEGGYGRITFDAVGVNWFDGVTECGLSPYAVDRFSVTLHELGHVFGVGTVPGWDAGSRARGVAIAADGSHFAADVNAAFSESGVRFGRRFLLTTVDCAALSDLGWDAGTPVGFRGPVLASIQEPGGLCRLYVLTETGLRPTALVSSLLFVADDYNYDGVPDLRVRTPGAGFDAIVNGRDGSLLAAEAVFAPVSVLVGRLP